MFTLPDTETDKKWAVKNCVEMFTLHRHNNAIEYCYNLSVSVLVSVSVSVLGSVNTPLYNVYFMNMMSIQCKFYEYSVHTKVYN